MKVFDIITEIERFAPLALQESYDNAGLLVGNVQQPISSALLCIDVTEEVIDEAIEIGAGLIISHHPLIFGGLKRITGKNAIERCVVRAIQHSIAIYAAHTNLDAVHSGVNKKICDKIGLQSTAILRKQSQLLSKIITFVPHSHTDIVRQAMCDAGAGTIGEYDNCSFNTQGVGTFRALDDAKPYVGAKGEMHSEDETKIEVLCPNYSTHAVLAAMKQAHPYEMPAYDIIHLANTHETVGSGMIGTLPQAVPLADFLAHIKQQFGCAGIRYSGSTEKLISKVAVCGGSGSFLISDAISQRADIFLTGDVKYHDFFLAENKIVVADIGHYESEQYTKEIFYEIINKKFPTFALQFSKVNTNPIKYV